MSRKSILLSILALLIVIGAVMAYRVYTRVYDRYYGKVSVRIYVPEGTSESALRDTLETRLGDFGKNVFWVWKLQKADPKKAHGSYVVDIGENAIALSRRLRSGRQTPLRVTFNNIRTLDMLAERIASKMEWGADDFIVACDSVLPAKGFRKAQYTAAFLPDTYEFFWTTDAVDVVRRLSDVRDAFWNDERRAKAASMGLNPVGVATIASIVEEETAKADERPKVARLYMNRLDRGMLLQADPTVKFALGDFGLRRIYNSHLAVDSPYNTYKYKGLPPGPIRVAERATLEAVLDAPKHNYIYMCAKEDFSGYHNFAADITAHNGNAARYHRALSARNIR